MADNVLQAETMITLDDLMQLEGIEIIDGEIVPMAAAGVEHQLIGGNTYDVLKPFAKQNNLGMVFYDNLTYLMFSPAPRLRYSFVPDISFIALADLLPDLDLSKPYPGVPTLAVEIASPDDKAEILQGKVRMYLDKGTAQVWLIFPATREVHQYRRDANPYIRIYLQMEDRIDVEALFPGLELTLATIFEMPVWAKRQDAE
jgi:Uma2 family endonuclease